MISVINGVVVALNSLLIFFSLLILLKDFFVNPSGVLMNIFSFTLLFGVFYYGVPFLNIEFLYSFFGYSIEQNSIIIAKFFAFWALCIFFLVYILTRQKHLR